MCYIVVYYMSDDCDVRKGGGETQVPTIIEGTKRLPGLTFPSDERTTINSAYAFSTDELRRE